MLTTIKEQDQALSLFNKRMGQNREIDHQIEYHRNTFTAWEIKFGECATHYKTFDIIDLLKADGTLKKWIKCPYDGLRYYR
jgi:hypothetical protein